MAITVVVQLCLLILSTASLVKPLTTPNGNTMSLAQLLHPPSSSSPFKNVTIFPRPQPQAGGPNPTPPTEPIYCITKPRLHRINEITCTPMIGPLIHNEPACLVRKSYSAPVTEFGESPCHIELRKSEAKGVILISDEQIGHAAVAVLQKCEEKGGAGWGQFESESGWCK
ncbi:MAG: hypothetical protein Q9166_003607 [cf. Caloplaca sp. 2 TL-2023]